MSFDYYEIYHLHENVDKKGTSYTKTEIDNKLATLYTKTETDNKLATLKTEIINMLPSK